MYVAGRFLFGAPPISLKDAELLLLYALRRMDAHALMQLPDTAEGFENVLYRAARTAATLEELLSGLKSKRYTMARLKRLCMNAFLGFTKEHIRLLSEEDALYIRVLGFKKSARALLTAIHQKQTLPFVVRHADIQKCPDHAQALLQMDTNAHALYSLLAREEKPAADFSRPPITL
jgi:predicted nucleotidyltransferase